MAGKFGVLLHERFKGLGWLLRRERNGKDAYDLAPEATKVLEELGIDVGAVRSLRRRFAYPCLDWSEGRPHIGGALGFALLKTAMKRRWVIRELDRMQRNFEPMRKQVEAWQRSELTDVTGEGGYL